MKLRAKTVAAALLFASLGAAMKGAATLPMGFQDTTVFAGLTQPTAVRFAKDGRVFVAEKSGVIKVFETLLSTTPTIFADLSTEVDDYWDRGLLGLELHPNFPDTPYVYVLYSYDFDPVTGNFPAWNDNCPNPPGATTSGCTILGRLSRLTASGNHMTGTEQVLLESWGQQFQSHSIGDLHFGADGALYVSGGDGASTTNVDYGQYGIPKNPLGDPPVPRGGQQTPPTAEGGALRSLSLLRAEGGPAVPSGAVLRLDDNGNALPDNPLAGSSDEIAQRIIAYGLRNPFRFTIQPATGAVWIGDVGWSDWEEIDEQPDPTASVKNFGWPCYEGNDPQPSYQSTGLALCNNLYATPGAATPPVYTYNHQDKVVDGETCPTGSSSITGLAFYGGGGYPASYDGALFFGDYSRRCIWVMLPDAGGHPDPTQRRTFVAGAATPVDLEIGPGGDLFYVDLGGGAIRRVQYSAPNAIATAAPTSGSAPLQVQFDGTGSLPAHPGDTLSYAWDLNGDGNFNESTAAKPLFTYTTNGSYEARLKVTDNHGVSSVSDPITIAVGDSYPTAFVDTPSSTLTWKVGDTIAFSGHATDPQEGTLPPSALTWNVIQHHCPSNCHTHPVQTITGVANGFFFAPDHEYPSWLELQLTATDSAGLSSSQSVILNPVTTTLTYQSSPSGLVLVSGTRISATPFTDTVIVGSQKTIVAASPQSSGGIPYSFVSWSDGGAASHSIVAGSSSATYAATFAAADLSLSAQASPTTVCPGGAVDWSLTASNGGPSAATSVSVAATLPSGTTLQSWSGDGWSCSGTGPVTCTRARMDVGPAPGLTLSLAVGTPPGDLALAATVSAATSDPGSGNNSSSTPVALGCVPLVQAVTPASGPAAGATVLTLSGENFQPGASVTIGGAAATGVVVTGPTDLTATAPALPPGTLNDVATRNPSGESGMLARGYLSDFSDVPGGYTYHGGISKIFRAGITSGCGAGKYCPELPVTRGEMAVFLLRGMHTSSYHPPAATGTVFQDVPLGTPFGAWIEELAAEGITTGCDSENYCPDDPVTRTSMAVLLLRAKHGASYQPPPATGDVFDDVPLGTYLGRWIEELAAEGITSGCGPKLYCPNGLVSRGEMAAFLSRTFSLP